MNACPSVVNQPDERCILVWGTLNLVPDLPQDEGIQIEIYIGLVFFEKYQYIFIPFFPIPFFPVPFLRKQVF